MGFTLLFLASNRSMEIFFIHSLRVRDKFELRMAEFESQILQINDKPLDSFLDKAELHPISRDCAEMIPASLRSLLGLKTGLDTDDFGPVLKIRIRELLKIDI